MLALDDWPELFVVANENNLLGLVGDDWYQGVRFWRHGALVYDNLDKYFKI